MQESVVRATLAAGAAAVAGLFLPASVAAAVAVLAIGCAVAPPIDWASASVAAVCALAAAAGGRIGGGVGHAIEGAAIGGMLARGVDGPKRLVAFTLGTLGALTAALVARAFAATEALAALPNGMQTLVVGATGGFVVGVSSVGRHVALLKAPAEQELRAMADDSELGKLLGRAAAAYRDAVAAIGGEAPSVRAAADDMLGKMTRFGKRWRELEAEAARSLPNELRERLMLVGRRLDASNDPLARAELARAREQLSAQLAYLEEIANGRERAVARLEHQVATLERLRLAALRHRSADAARMGSELAPLVDELAQAGGDFDIAAEALTEATATTHALPAARN